MYTVYLCSTQLKNYIDWFGGLLGWLLACTQFAHIFETLLLQTFWSAYTFVVVIIKGHLTITFLA